MELRCNLVRKLTDMSGVSQTNGQKWRIATYLARIEGMYEKHIAFEVSDGMSGRVALFDQMVGRGEVVVGFDIDANEFNGRWYNKIRAYGVKQMVAMAPPAEKQADSMPHPEQATSVANGDSTGPRADGLPF